MLYSYDIELYHISLQRKELQFTRTHLNLTSNSVTTQVLTPHCRQVSKSSWYMAGCIDSLQRPMIYSAKSRGMLQDGAVGERRL